MLGGNRIRVPVRDKIRGRIIDGRVRTRAASAVRSYPEPEIDKRWRSRRLVLGRAVDGLPADALAVLERTIGLAGSAASAGDRHLAVLANAEFHEALTQVASVPLSKGERPRSPRPGTVTPADFPYERRPTPTV